MINPTRTGAVIRKELAEFRRNRLIVVTATVLPIVFLISPTASILAIHAAAYALLSKRVDYSLFLPLLVPLFVPATMSAYSVVGEKEQGTLEPVLTTPITRVEASCWARRPRSSSRRSPSPTSRSASSWRSWRCSPTRRSPPRCGTRRSSPVEVLFIPLLAAWAIWVGLAISSKVTETRVAQQLSVLGSLPPLALISLMSFQVITPSFGLAAALRGRAAGHRLRRLLRGGAPVRPRAAHHRRQA